MARLLAGILLAAWLGLMLYIDSPSFEGTLCFIGITAAYWVIVRILPEEWL